MRWTLPIWLGCLLVSPAMAATGEDDVRQVLDIAVPMVDQAEAQRADGNPGWEGTLANALAMLRLTVREGAPEDAFLALARAESLAGDDQAVADAYAGYLQATTTPDAPGAVQARAYLAEHYTRLGIEALVQDETQRATENFRAVLTYDPSNEMAKARLARLAGGVDAQGTYWMPPSGTTEQPVSVPVEQAPQQCLERARTELEAGNWASAFTYLSALKDLGRTDTLAASLAVAAAGMTGAQAPFERQLLESARDAGLLGGFVGMRSALAGTPAGILRGAILLRDDIRAYGSLNRAGAERTEFVAAYASERVLLLLGRLNVDAQIVGPAPYVSLELESSEGVRVSPLPNRPWPVLQDFLGPELSEEGTIITFPATDASGAPLITPATEWLALTVKLADPGEQSVRLMWPLTEYAAPVIVVADAAEVAVDALPNPTTLADGGPPLQRWSPDDAVTPGPEVSSADERPVQPVEVATPQPLVQEIAAAGSITGPDDIIAVPTYVHSQGHSEANTEQPLRIEPSSSRPLGALSGEGRTVDPARATPVVLVADLGSEEAVCDAFLPQIGRAVTIGEDRGIALWFAAPYIDALLGVTTDPAERAQLLALEGAARTNLVFLISMPEPEGEGALPLATRCVLQDAHANRRRGRELASAIENAPPSVGAPGQYICFAKTSRTQHTIEVETTNELELTVEIGRTIVPPKFVWALPLPLPKSEPTATP